MTTTVSGRGLHTLGFSEKEVFELLNTQDFLINNLIAMCEQKLHVAIDLLEIIKSTVLEEVSSKDMCKFNVEKDNMWDSDIFKKTELKPYSLNDFLVTLIYLLKCDEGFKAPFLLNTNGTRDDMPSNVFYVQLIQNDIRRVHLVKDKDSDGNTFGHWYLNWTEFDSSKLDTGSTIFCYDLK